LQPHFWQTHRRLSIAFGSDIWASIALPRIGESFQRVGHRTPYSAILRAEKTNHLHCELNSLRRFSWWFNMGIALELRGSVPIDAIFVHHYAAFVTSRTARESSTSEIAAHWFCPIIGPRTIGGPETRTIIETRISV